ncbi:MAG: DUF4399 domain-containing protein, partial [Alcaligenaceae bacterium]
VKPAELAGPRRIEMFEPKDNSSVRGAFKVQMHASGWNISHAGPKLPDTGHFRITAERAGGKAEVIDLRGGQTEVWLEPPAGDYRLQVELVANDTGAVAATGAPVKVRAEAYAKAAAESVRKSPSGGS